MLCLPPSQGFSEALERRIQALARAGSGREAGKGERGVKARRQAGLCLVWPRRRRRERGRPRGTGHGHGPAAPPGAVPEPGAGVSPPGSVGSWGHPECRCKRCVLSPPPSSASPNWGDKLGTQVAPRHWVTDGFVPCPGHLESATLPGWVSLGGGDSVSPAVGVTCRGDSVSPAAG